MNIQNRILTRLQFVYYCLSDLRHLKSAFAGLLMLTLLLVTVSHASAQTGWSNTRLNAVYLGFIITEIDRGHCGDECDFYAKPTIDGVTQSNEDKGNQDLLENDNSIRPDWRLFQAISPVSVTYDMKLRIYDEDGGFNGGDDHLDIHPGSGKDHELVFSPWDCKVNGNIGSFRGTFRDGMCTIHINNTGGTSGDRAEVSYTLVAFWELTYEKPQIQGYRLDHCAYSGTLCGLQAAYDWCKTLRPAYKAATDFVKEDSVWPTYIINTGEICSATGCDSFSEITCTTFHDNQY